MSAEAWAEESVSASAQDQELASAQPAMNDPRFALAALVVQPPTATSTTQSEPQTKKSGPGIRELYAEEEGDDSDAWLDARAIS